MGEDKSMPVKDYRECRVYFRVSDDHERAWLIVNGKLEARFEGAVVRVQDRRHSDETSRVFMGSLVIGLVLGIAAHIAWLAWW